MGGSAERGAASPSVTLNSANPERAAWTERVFERYENRCGGCGGENRLSAHLLVPLEAGGSYSEFNGCVLCRGCEMARDVVMKPATTKRRPINIWVSTYLYQLLDARTAEGCRFRSMGELFRYLIELYVRSPERFDDLEKYQDQGTERKVNAWVDDAAYLSFKALLDGRRMTVTDALKGLILLYAECEDTLGRGAMKESGRE